MGVESQNVLQIEGYNLNSCGAVILPKVKLELWFVEEQKSNPKVKDVQQVPKHHHDLINISSGS